LQARWKSKGKDVGISESCGGTVAVAGHNNWGLVWCGAQLRACLMWSPRVAHTMGLALASHGHVSVKIVALFDYVWTQPGSVSPVFDFILIA
jgi:hypothetical protein